MSKMAVWTTGLALVTSLGCGPTLHLPMTAADLAHSHDRHALPMYLSQPRADPAVCDASAPGPHVMIDDEGTRALVGAMVDGQVAPPVWRSCVDRIFASAGRAGQTQLLDEIARGYGALLGDPARRIEKQRRALVIGVNPARRMNTISKGCARVLTSQSRCSAL